MSTRTTPQDFFLWLGTVIALYISAGSLIALSFGIIDAHLTVQVLGHNPHASGLSFATAMLLVIFPVYIALTRILHNAQRRDPQRADIWVRRWSIYLTLFLAGGGMLIDLVTLLYTYLQGEEMTLSFLLKVLTVLIIFGSAFYYYLKDINGYWRTHERQSKQIGAVVVAIIIAAIILGFYTAGSPRTQRLMRLDDQRIDDLTTIQYTLSNHYRNKQALPETLIELNDPLVSISIPTDPGTGAAYEYERTDEATFRLCATFALPQIIVGEDADLSDYTVRRLAEEAEQWPHDIGRTCFTREIDPDNHKSLIPLPTP